jgi:flagellum-specific peptidoglycan hydrolase FlgJ
MKKKKKKSFGKFIMAIVAATFAVLIAIEVNAINNAKYKDINLEQLNTKQYIQIADKISSGKLQINWQYVAAIDGVRYENDFSKATDESITSLANMFLEKNSTSTKFKDNEYKLVDLDTVISKFDFDKEKRDKVYHYIDNLKYTGTQKNSLNNSSKQEFVKGLYSQATDIYNKYGVLPSITISQAILESGWGKSELSTKANNLFGIKADNSWKGKKVKMNTSEYYNKKITDYFRVYSSNEESLKDYGEFLKNNKRYKESGVFKATQYIEQANAIEKSGYSTVQNDKGENIYAELLTEIIQEQNLQLLDFECEMNFFNNK